MSPAIQFSMITAIKDGFPEFRKTLPTVLAQTHSSFEWIIVDDGSSESVASVFPQLSKDPRVTVLRQESGKGQTASLNLGIRHSRGSWVVRMDGDDLCHPGRLASIKSAIEQNPSAQLVFSNFRVLDEYDKEWSEVRLRTPLSGSFFRYLKERNNPVCHPTVAFRKLDSRGSLRLYRDDLLNAQDYALWKEILAKEGPDAFVHIPEPTVGYRVARNSLSGANAPEQREELKAIRENKSLAGAIRSTAVLNERQRNAMQAYRLLFFRFVGCAEPASISDDLSLLAMATHSPRLFLNAFFFLAMRPFRKILLQFLFAGIYK